MRSILVTIAVLAVTFTTAQKPQFSLDGDTARIQIGEQVKLELNAHLPKGSLKRWPVLPDTISGLTLVNSGSIDTLESSTGLKLRQTIKITSFDSGYVVIPELSLETSQGIAGSKRFIIEVIIPEVSEEKGFFDIKKPLSVPRTWWDYARWVLAGLVLLAIILLIRYWLRKPKAKSAQVAPEPKLPPAIYARQQLDILEGEQLWQEGKIKEYYSRLVDVLRLYLERQFAVKAMESTAGELAQKVIKFNLPDEDLSKLQKMLQTSAMVKYAKEKPLDQDNETAIALVRKFIKHTEPKGESSKDAELPVSKS